MPSWGNACETIPFLYCHFERKREIFFRSRSSRRCEDSGIFVSQPSPQGEGAPKGRIGQERDERERGDRLKCAVYGSTLSTADAVPLPQRGRQRGGGSAAKNKATPASLRSAAPSKGRGSRGHSLLPLEGGAPKGRIGQERYERERGRSSQVCHLRQHPIHRWRGPPSPRGKAKRKRLRRIY